MHILHVVGARPNFMKAAPVLHALTKQRAVEQTLVHTGQHYDANMSDVFFSQLGVPAPDVTLGVGSGSHRSWFIWLKQSQVGKPWWNGLQILARLKGIHTSSLC